MCRRQAPWSTQPLRGNTKIRTWEMELILDLSFPDESSINAGISKELSTLACVSLDEVVDTILMLGAGCLLTKIDIQSAYRLIPVHPQDRHLLGMKWQGALYIDCVLPFGSTLR